MSNRRLKSIGVGAIIALALTGCHRARAGVDVTPADAAPAAAAPAGAPFPTPPVLPGTPDIATLVAKVQPSVVNITTEHQLKIPRFDFGAPFGSDPFSGMFGLPRRGEGVPVERMPKQRSLGSGFIVDTAGHVVTNAHVVEGADDVRVKLADGRELKAKVKGKDERLDLAVLELEGAKDLSPAALGSSEVLRVGEYVVAIGNPFGLGHTVTMGIVSAKSRTIGAGPYDDFIQTDASINPGNSGGPLFNLRGEVVGINTAINPNGRGIGFAIPSDALKDVLPQLLGAGHVTRGRLGVLVQPVDEPLAEALGTDRAHGALVAEVEPGGPAAKAGFESGDIILSVAGVDVPSSRDLPRLVARHAPGARVSFKVSRRGAERTLEATLDPLKDDPRPPSPAPAASAPPRLGVELSDAPSGGASVRRVQPGSPADGQLQPGDVIVEVDRERVASARDAASRIGRADRRGPVLLRVEREGKGRYVAIEPGKEP